MSLVAFLALSAVLLLLAYRRMGRTLARVVGLDNAVRTGAHTKRDGLEHEPAQLLAAFAVRCSLLRRVS